MEPPRVPTQFARLVTLGHQTTCALLRDVARTFPGTTPDEQLALAFQVLTDVRALLERSGLVFALREEERP